MCVCVRDVLFGACKVYVSLVHGLVQMPAAASISRVSNASPIGYQKRKDRHRSQMGCLFCPMCLIVSGNGSYTFLVGGLVAIFEIVPYIGNVIIPIDELIFFQRGGPTTNQFWYVHV